MPEPWVQAARLHLIADLDSRPDAVAGAAAGRVAQTFLAGACRVGAGQAARDVAAARALPVAEATCASATDATDAAPADIVAPGSLLGDGASTRLPALAAAFARGAVSRAHVDVAVKAVARIPSSMLGGVDEQGRTGLAKVDAFLTEQARRHCPTALDKLVRHLVEVVDPDGASGFDPEAYRRRSCVTAVDSLGMLVGRFTLDPAGAVVVAAALDTFAALPPDGTAVDEFGEVHDVVDDRTREQRRADALVLIAQRAMAAPDAPLRAQVSVVTRLDQVQRAARAHTRHTRYAVPALTDAAASAPDDEPFDADGPWLAHADAVGPISDAVLAHATCDAVLTRLTLTPSGAPIDVGRSLRLATPAQRRALTARDFGCVIPGCGVPANGCDAHHVVHWGVGGATDLDNLALLCPRHHAAHHQGVWEIEIRDGIPWVIPPPWVDPHRRALLNTTHADAARAARLARDLRAPLRWKPQRRAS
ncbi:MAG: DUF222 domain-containing protein [Kineosporiaceae bacterium]